MGKHRKRSRHSRTHSHHHAHGANDRQHRGVRRRDTSSSSEEEEHASDSDHTNRREHSHVVHYHSYNNVNFNDGEEESDDRSNRSSERHDGNINRDNNVNPRLDREHSVPSNREHATEEAAVVNHAAKEVEVVNHDPPANRHRIDPSILQAKETSHRQVRKDLEVISIQTCQQSKYHFNVKVPEKKGVVGVLLSLRTAYGTNRTVVTSGGARYSKDKTLLTSLHYDRILTFADCSNSNGTVFAVLLETKVWSNRFFQEAMLGQEGVGDLFLLEEVEPLEDTLGSTTNVLLAKRVNHVLPLKEDDLVRIVPQVPAIAPKKGATRYFSQHHVTNLEFGQVFITAAICGGDLCDRQEEYRTTGQSCGCFYKRDHHNPLVIEMAVSLPCSRDYKPSGIMTVKKFRSLRTSEIFIPRDHWSEVNSDQAQHEEALRNCVARVTQYINKNGGWTYIGWVRTGSVADQSEISNLKDAENISSMAQVPHISYLYPTNPKIVDRTNTIFEQLQLQSSELEPIY